MASRAATVDDIDREAPRAGEIFRQPDLAATLRKLVEAEQQALEARQVAQAKRSTPRTTASTKATSPQEIARGTQEQGGLITTADLAKWQVKTEEPVKTTYKGIDVYKLTVWTQGPSMLQALNILENFDLKSMGYNSARYIHTLYQAMNLAFADRDFYYGDPSPDFPPHEPVLGLLSKEYARERAKLVKPDRNDPNIGPGDPYPYQRDTNPFLDVLRNWSATATKPRTTAALRAFRRVVPPRHDVDRSGGRRRLGGLGHAERRLDSGRDRRQDRHRPQPARAELRHRPRAESLQRHRAGQAPARHAHARRSP